MPLLIAFVYLSHAHGVVTERDRVQPGQRACIVRHRPFEHDLADAWHLGVAGHRDVDLCDRHVGASTVETHLDGVEHFLSECVELDVQIRRLHFAQAVVFVRGRGLGGVLVLTVDAGQQRFDAGAQLNAKTSFGKNADFDQRGFDDVGVRDGRKAQQQDRDERLAGNKHETSTSLQRSAENGEIPQMRSGYAQIKIFAGRAQ